jgi:hypothetical protein
MQRIRDLMKNDTAGDPMNGMKWTRKTTEKLAVELRSLGINVCGRTVARLLTKLGFSLRVNHKKRSNGSPKERDAQFGQIAELRDICAKHGIPLISVDTKKKELVGQFRNPGRTWQQEAIGVNDHDFPSLSKGKGIPYGILDIPANRGFVFVGTSRDTPQFATDCIEKWWRLEGKARYPNAIELVILADAGGSNGYRPRGWKYGLHRNLCLRHGLTVTVAHYPPGASKWNPIDHRLFSEISKNWAGRPLDSYETILKYIRTTKTKTGLRVRARLVDRVYETKVRIPDRQLSQLGIDRAPLLSQWNYTLTPENGKL